MKILRKHGLTFVLLAALIVTFALGVVFMMPAKTVSADEEFVPQNTVTVTSEQALKKAVADAADTPTKIILGGNIEMNSVTSGAEGTKYYELIVDRGQRIQLDLAGHTLSVILNPTSKYVIVNYGTLSIIDSSGNYSGKVVSNGYIVKQTSGDDWSVENPGYIWRPASVIYSYGDLTINANIGLETPESKGAPGEDGYYNGTHPEHTSMIISSLYVPDADDPDQTISNSSVTVEGGTFSGKYMYVFQLEDADLTIKDGTFTTLASTGYMKETYLFATAPYAPEPSYWPRGYEDEDYNFTLYPGEAEKVEQTLKEHSDLIDRLTPYHHSTIEIIDGDFTAYTGDSSCFEIETEVNKCIEIDRELWDWKREKVGEATFSFALTGGRWGRDLSDYVPDGYWMELFQETTQDGDILSKYYQVGRIDENRAGALLEVNDEKHYYSTFASALLAAKTVQAETRTITLLSDNQIGQIGLTDLKGELRLDLNGYKLTVEPTNTYHIIGGNGAAYKNTFIICDGSAQQEGELILSVKSGNAISNGSFIQVSQNTKFILESGTIRQTGYVPATYYDAEAASYKRNVNLLSLFKLKDKVQITNSNVNTYADCVQIKGGNILSDLTFGTADNIVGRRTGELFAWWDGKSYAYPDYECGLGDGAVSAANKKTIFVVDLKDYLADGTTACRFAWDFNDIVSSDGMSSSSDGNGNYIVTLVSEEEYFIVGTKKVATLQAALQEAKENATISVLKDATVSGDVEIGNGITLNLNSVVNFKVTFEGKLTLKDGASIKNGTIICNDITLDGDVTLEDVTVTGKDDVASAVTVQGGTVTIPSGKYNCDFTVGGGTLDITGGFFRGDQIDALDQYFGEFLGGYIAAGEAYQQNELYEVKFAPDLDAQEWYKKYKNNADKTFLIGKPEEWGYFALYVNSGVDSFQGKIVKISANLDFASGTASGIALAAEANEPNFMPAGNKAHSFFGTIDGDYHVISGIVAREKYVGLIGYSAYNSSENSLQVNNLTVKDSVFTVGNGFLDAFNVVNATSEFLAGGAIIGFSHFGVKQANITLDHVTVDCDTENLGAHRTYSGAIIGHTFGGVSVENLEMTGSTVMGNWKTGGVVGFNESGSIALKEAHISDVTIDGSSSAGVVAGHTQGSNVTLENCTVETPDQSLIGSASVRKGTQEIKITGPKTDIHVESLGQLDNKNANQTVAIELSTDGEGNASQVQFSSGATLPPNLTVTNNGDEVDLSGGLKTDPENGSFIFEADPKPVDLYTDEANESVHQGSYSTLTEALAKASKGDRIYVNGDIKEDITIAADQEVIINLLGNTLTGNITIQANGMLTLEYGTVAGSITNNGTLKLVVPALGEGETAIKELKITAEGKAIDGEYTVETNGNEVCVRVSDSEIYLTKDHEAGAYTAAGDTITIRCLHDDTVLGTVRIVAPANATFSNEKIEATVEIDPEGFIEAPEITYTDAEGNPVEEILSAGKYTASIKLGDVTASVTFVVKQQELTITDIEGTISYQGDTALTIDVESYTLKDLNGTVVELENITVTVTLEKSKYSVGNDQYALITEIHMSGNDNYALSTVGNQLYMKLDVTPTTLTVRVNNDGSVSYVGFVGGEDESVLGGSLKLDYTDNGDGTSTVTPSGLESINYHIVYEAGIVSNNVAGGENNALWIVLGVLGAVAVAAVATVIVCEVRRKRN